MKHTKHTRQTTRVAAIALTALWLATMPATASAAVTIGSTTLSCAQVQFWANGVGWADLHYSVNGGGQVNVRMAQSGTSATYTVSGLASGALIRSFFTYVPSGSNAAVDTAWNSTTVSCGPTVTDACTACKYHNLVWADEFTGSGQPSSSSWNYHVGNGWSSGVGSFSGWAGWGNGEWEWYRPEQCSVQNGSLVLRADYASSPTTIAGANWYQRSCRITTQGKLTWSNARVEARIAMPAKISVWPAFWLMGASNNGSFTTTYAAPLDTYDSMATNWASCGEIDVMEHVNADGVAHQNLFWDTRTGIYPWSGSTVANNLSSFNVGDVTQFHTYAVEWDASTMTWYVDNAPVKTQSVSAGNMEEYRQGFFVILNLALAGSFPNTTPVQSDFPLSMYVDYVRVYQ